MCEISYKIHKNSVNEYVGDVVTVVAKKLKGGLTVQLR